MSTAAQRLEQLAKHTSSSPSTILTRNDNDVVVVAAVRTALTRARKGGFKDTAPEDLLRSALVGVVDRAGINKALVEDVQVGNVLPVGGGATVARMAQLSAGFPETCSISTVNRQCSSGLQAINGIATQIMAGQIDIGIGAGVESMTFGGFGGDEVPKKMSESIGKLQIAADCLLPMGITSENVAAKYGVSREQQDAFAAASFAKAVAAQDAGKFKSEIVPTILPHTDPRTGVATNVVVAEDDGIRRGITPETLAKLKPVFKKDGTSTAGTSSQLTDGAAAVLLARRRVALDLGLPILGRYVTAAVVGVPPALMGVGPAFAIPKALDNAKISIHDVDFFEINEAFASQALMSINHLSIPIEKVNLNGGAIALGHPLGATGARQVATAYPLAKATGAKVFVTSMCIGSGMGMAAVWTNEQH